MHDHADAHGIIFSEFANRHAAAPKMSSVQHLCLAYDAAIYLQARQMSTFLNVKNIALAVKERMLTVMGLLLFA